MDSPISLPVLLVAQHQQEAIQSKVSPEAIQRGQAAAGQSLLARQQKMLLWRHVMCPILVNHLWTRPG